MNSRSYEKTNFRDRAREMGTLFSFIIGALILSVIAMDIVVFPMALFSLKNKDVFNLVMANFMRIAIAGIFLYMISINFYRLKKDGLPAASIMKIMFFKPFKFLLSLLIFFLITFSLIYVIYSIMNYNNYLLYKLVNI